jgi:hypothetical protein
VSEAAYHPLLVLVIAIVISERGEEEGGRAAEKERIGEGGSGDGEGRERIEEGGRKK